MIGPDAPSRLRRTDWARLLKRTFALDVLLCPKCGGGMELVALIEEAAVAKRILTHLGLPARAPPRGRPIGRQLHLAIDDPPTLDDVEQPATFH